MSLLAMARRSRSALIKVLISQANNNQFSSFSGHVAMDPGHLHVQATADALARATAEYNQASGS